VSIIFTNIVLTKENPCSHYYIIVILHCENEMDMRKELMILAFAATSLSAQEVWSVEECMKYAIEHNHEVRKKEFALDSYKAERVASIGAFLPSIGAETGAEYNFGRAIDPETNMYIDENTFANWYGIGANLPIFDGLQKIHQLRAARADVLMGKSALQSERDMTALSTFQAYADVLYYQGIVKMAEEKVEESRMTLRQTMVMEEVGQKSPADVAQIEAQLATDEYDLTMLSGKLATAKLQLKQTMNINVDIEVMGGCESFATSYSDVKILSCDDAQMMATSPLVQQALYAEKSAKAKLNASWGEVMPSLSLSVGVNTRYNKVLGVDPGMNFGEQFKNKLGEYVSFNLSVPIFNRLRSVSNIRKARSAYHIAQEDYLQKCDELRKLSEQAVCDRDNYHKQALQMEKKVSSDSIAYHLMKRKYEEGMASPIDVQTTSAALLKSRASLLQCQLMFALKNKLVEYYNGSFKF